MADENEVPGMADDSCHWELSDRSLAPIKKKKKKKKGVVHMT
jgi:hypothetical protein